MQRGFCFVCLEVKPSTRTTGEKVLLPSQAAEKSVRSPPTTPQGLIEEKYSEESRGCLWGATEKILTLIFILKQLLSAKFEDVIQLLLGHGSSLGAQPRPHHQVC
jgi:hypothetical protein